MIIKDALSSSSIRQPQLTTNNPNCCCMYTTTRSIWMFVKRKDHLSCVLLVLIDYNFYFYDLFKDTGSTVAPTTNYNPSCDKSSISQCWLLQNSSTSSVILSTTVLVRQLSSFNFKYCSKYAVECAIAYGPTTPTSSVAL